MNDKKCQVCTYFPCLRFECNIGNKQGCDDFKSYTNEFIEKFVDKKD